MASGRRVGQRPDCHTFLCKFWHFQMAVSQWKLAWLTSNLGILWISVCSSWLCESVVANPIIYRLVPRPSRFETRQFVAWNTRNFKPEYLVKWKAPADFRCWTRTDVAILDADQKARGLRGRECLDTLDTSKINMAANIHELVYQIKNYFSNVELIHASCWNEKSVENVWRLKLFMEVKIT